MELSAGIQEMSVGQPAVKRGPPCAKCKGACKGFQPHPWRKSCELCRCPREEHILPTEVEEDHRIGHLLSDTRYAGLTARVKGSDGLRVYKRNRMIITNPITSRKDPTFLTITYEWAPPGLNQKLAMSYMELLPKNLQPVAGTEGAHYRRLQQLRQIPPYDHEPTHCHGLAEAERPAMAAFVKQYKEKALGVGVVALPCSAKSEHKDSNAAETPNGTEEQCNGKTDYLCELCQQLMPPDAPAVYSDHADYKKQWHPACFVCCQCREPLVNLIHFWKNNRLWCGRHYCESERPRCMGCDEIIFSEDYLRLDGKFWHRGHFSCVGCEQALIDRPYKLEQGSASSGLTTKVGSFSGSAVIDSTVHGWINCFVLVLSQLTLKLLQDTSSTLIAEQVVLQVAFFLKVYVDFLLQSWVYLVENSHKAVTSFVDCSKSYLRVSECRINGILKSGYPMIG
ncbi:LIM and cysteine-rich domains protein 1 [Gastrophryne carolinensis]